MEGKGKRNFFLKERLRDQASRDRTRPLEMLSMGSRGSELKVSKPRNDKFHQQELRSWPPANSIKHYHIGIFIVLLGKGIIITLFTHSLVHSPAHYSICRGNVHSVGNEVEKYSSESSVRVYLLL